MVNSLEELLSQLQQQEEKLSSSNEEAAKQAAVVPILSLLGWDVHNTLDEVYPEYTVGKDRVDYCLKIAGRPRVFVEAKKPGENLKNHEEQLLAYSYEQGVELAALTTGFLWWLYLPMRAAKKGERRFATTEIADTADAARLLRTFLSRSAVADGSAVRAAEEAIIKNVIPYAWGEVCKDQRESLLSQLSQRVYSLSGYKPAPERLADFLSWLSVPENVAEWEVLPLPGSDRSPGTKADRVMKLLQDGQWHTAPELRETLNTKNINYVLKLLRSQGLVELRESPRGNAVRIVASQKS